MCGAWAATVRLGVPRCASVCVCPSRLDSEGVQEVGSALGHDAAVMLNELVWGAEGLKARVHATSDDRALSVSVTSTSSGDVTVNELLIRAGLARVSASESRYVCMPMWCCVLRAACCVLRAACCVVLCKLVLCCAVLCYVCCVVLCCGVVWCVVVCCVVS